FFPWTGTTSLGSYCVSATSSHYDWAIKKIRAHIRAQQALKPA
ncbi:MAG: ClbS/DfsB family four-helix bundle protein, partial [Microbacteriaceae bacterium]